MQLVLYHNPRCSKSRQALALLEERGLKPTVIRYLETPPSLVELKRLAKQLEVVPREMMRAGDDLFRELGLDAPGTTDDRLFAAMAAHPALIERPILVAGRRAVIGRPPERVLELI